MPAVTTLLPTKFSHLSTPEMAERLTVSANTVRTHIKSIYGKLGVHGRSGAVRRAQALGLLGKERSQNT
jgi:LuxR family transcriptional regulator, maltose regulon positive regulatory protein